MMEYVISEVQVVKCSLGKVLLFFFTIACFSQAIGAENQAKYLRPTGAEGKTRITGLKWVIPKETTEIRNTGKNLFQLFGVLNGSLLKPSGWKLVWNENNVILPASEAEARDFTIAIPINDEKTRLRVQAIGPNGQRETEELVIVFKDWSRISQTLRGRKKLVLKRKRNFLTPSLGVSKISYSETSYSSFNQTELTASILYNYKLSTRWNLFAGGFSTVLPLSTSLSGTTASFRGVNVAAEYSIPLAHDRWTINLSSGINYRTMSSSKNTFGYAPFLYPQFTPGFKRLLGKENVLRGYVTYGSLGSGFSPWNSSETEIGGGLTWDHILRNGKTLSIKAEHSNISFRPEKATDIEIQSTTLSLGMTF